MTNISSILDEAPTEVHEVPLLPAGTYRFIVGMAAYGKSAKKQTDFVEFPLRPVEALEDVDLDALDEMGGLEGKSTKATFYYGNDYGLRQLDEFHLHCGIEFDPTVSRRMRNDNCMNASVVGVIKHEPSQDGTRMMARFDRSLASE